MPATYDAIATTTLTSQQSSITFSSISAGYTDLRLVIEGIMSTNNVTPSLRFNSDSGTNYAYIGNYGDGSLTTASIQGTSQTGISFGLLRLWDVQNPFSRIVDIFSYADSGNKSILVQEINMTPSAGTAGFFAWRWGNTAAITSLTLVTNTGFFDVGFIATLYGILKA